MEPQTVQQLASPQQWWQYGVLGVGILVFGIVITILAKEYKKAIKANEAERRAISDERERWAVERTTWGIERERIRADFHSQHASLLHEYAIKINDEHKICQEREDAIRDDYDELTKLRSDEQKKTMEALADALDKLGGKITPTRRY